MDVDNEFTVADLSIKCKSKNELYNLLIREGKIFLPPAKDWTQKFMRELMHSEKRHIKLNKVRVIQVPQYEGLYVKDIIKFAKTKIRIKEYLPEFEYHKDPNRQWLCNLINFLIPEDFQDFIDNKVKLRRQSIIKQQNLKMTINPDFVNIFKSSNAISSEKGKSYFLTRLPKKSTYQKKYEEIYEEKKDLEKQTKDQNYTIGILNDKICEFEEIEKKYDNYSGKLHKLFELGIITEDGEPIKNDMN